MQLVYWAAVGWYWENAGRVSQCFEAKDMALKAKQEDKLIWSPGPMKTPEWMLD